MLLKWNFSTSSLSSVDGKQGMPKFQGSHIVRKRKFNNFRPRQLVPVLGPLCPLPTVLSLLPQTLPMTQMQIRRTCCTPTLLQTTQHIRPFIVSPLQFTPQLLLPFQDLPHLLPHLLLPLHTTTPANLVLSALLHLRCSKLVHHDLSCLFLWLNMWIPGKPSPPETTVSVATSLQARIRLHLGTNQKGKTWSHLSTGCESYLKLS
mmetsp:Transcript_26715/g.52653  ORF Transcript_26715/g.52653 Transcript_26715/m.52653 type:complete len:205 (+) Transcript_26715:1186-1800(+)